MATQESYPLLNARVGSYIKDGIIQSGRIFSRNSRITEFVKGEDIETFMSGSSKYVQSDKMNQGSFGVNGSFGISGVAKVNASVSGYYGKSSAQSGTGVSINYNAVISEGKESLVKTELSIADFINSMADNPKRQLLRVLDNYKNLIKETEDVHKNIHSASVAKAIKSKKVKDALKAWSTSVDAFFKSYGEAVVITVHWGAFGFLNLQFNKEGSASNEKYGGEADFSYASPGVGVSVKAAYSGSNSSIDNKAKAVIKTKITGNSISSFINEWKAKADGIAFKDLAGINMLQEIPSLEIPKNIKPSVPEFIKPKKESSLTDKIGGFSNMKSLDFYLQVQAFEKAKKENKDLTLSQFLKEAEKPVKTSEIEKVQITDVKIIKNLDADPKGKGEEGEGKSAKSQKHSEKIKTNDTRKAFSASNRTVTKEPLSDIPAQKAVADDLAENYVPVGIEICNWSELFPWLSFAYNNSLNDLSEAKQIINWRTMIQDFLALSNLYYAADEAHLEVSNVTTAIQVAKSFARMCKKLQENKEDDSYPEIMKKAFNGLSRSAQNIYKVWDDVAILRKAELGLGYINKMNGTSISTIEGVPITYFKNRNIQTVTDGKPCEYTVTNENHDAFSEFNKLLPIILPDGTIRAFNRFGYFGWFISFGEDKGTGKRHQLDKYNMMNNDGFHTKVSDSDHVFERMTFNPERPKLKRKIDAKFYFGAYSLALDKEKKYLGNVAMYNKKHALYPIPYKAANGIRWKGAASGVVSLSSFADLNNNIKQIKNELSGLKTWSFRNDGFSKMDWGLDVGLSDVDIKEQYIGIMNK